MACVEHQVLELVRLIHEEVVDAHHLEVHHIVLAICDAVLNIQKFGFKRLLAFLQPFEHGTGNVCPLLTKHFKVFLHRVHLLLQDSLLYLQGLRYHTELLVCQDDAVPIVIFDVIEDALSVLLGKIIFTRIEYLGIRISLAKGIGNVKDVCLQSDNHRFVS